MNRKILRKKLDSLISTYCKLRDNRVCQKCIGGAFSDNIVDAHHVIPKSRGEIFRWNPINILCLCRDCHTEWHRDPKKGGLWFAEKYSERSVILSELKPYKFTIDDYEEYIKVLSQLIQGLKDKKQGNPIGEFLISHMPPDYLF